MATITTALSISSSTVSSSPISLSLSDTLTVGSPSLGISRSVASVITPVSLVPATAGTKYCFVSHTGTKADGVTTSANTITLSTITAAPVAQKDTVTFNLLFITGDTINLTIDGVAQESIVFTTNEGTTADLVKTAILNHPSILSVDLVTGGSSHTYTVVGANPGDSYTIAATCTPSGSAAANATVTNVTAASGSSTVMLRPGEFTWLPVKAGEGLQAVAQGASTAEGVMCEYAYWTKATE
tara:strand:- start:282 stop:1004 length:723 start_codon:yes stop_codon:yes gene_type:complete